MSDRTIMALVPDLFFLSRLREAATSRAVTIEVVRRAERLAERASEVGPALIILDMGIVAQDWLSALQALRANPTTAQLPVVAFGPHVDQAAQAAARAAGATRVLANSRFVETVADLIDHYLPPVA